MRRKALKKLVLRTRFSTLNNASSCDIFHIKEPVDYPLYFTLIERKVLTTYTNLS